MATWSSTLYNLIKKIRSYDTLQSTEDFHQLLINSFNFNKVSTSKIYFSSFAIDVPKSFEKFVLTRWGDSESARREVMRAYSQDIAVTERIRESMSPQLQRLIFTFVLFNDEHTMEPILFIAAGSQPTPDHLHLRTEEDHQY